MVVGLGNPGAKYEKTRHNVGFIAADAIAARLGVKIDRARYNALTAEITLDGARGILMKPQTFMNNSGVAVREAARFYNIPPEKIIVLHDEISFEPGLFRIRRKGSAGGHNGLKSIIEHIGSQDFPRIKLGVGQKPHPDYDLADWVLSKMPEEDMKKFTDRLEDVYSSVRLIVGGDIDGAMSKYSK
ncbi:MAG: aminoacyl-tRNA hydrolase [Clostridia bacterium]|nr:aminoacyl-tRNA hydrolase [Clostridia bacterium]